MPEFLVTPPTALAVSLDDVKLALRVTHNLEDTHIESLIKAATKFLEDRLGQQFITATWRLILDEFDDEIRLPRPPLITVSSITYVDSGGTTQTLDAADYQINSSRMPALISPARLSFWPASDSDTYNAVQVNYTAGYGATEASVPDTIKQAIKMLVSHWYQVREPVAIGTISGPIELTLDAILASVWHGDYAGAC